MAILTEQSLSQSGYTTDQIQEIIEGQNENLDVSFYTNPSFLSIQMYQIRLGLEEGLSVEYYAKPFYDWFQMEEIRKGLLASLDVSIYARPAIPYNKMRQIRKGLINGINLSPYIGLEVGILRELRKSLASGVSLIPYIKAGYNREQLEAIRHALQKNIDITPYLNINYRGSSIKEIRLGLEHGVNVSLYAKPVYSWRKMREIRLGLEHRLNVSKYANPLYSYWQMQEIRLGLEDNLDIDDYSSFMYTAKEMKKRRLQQLEQSNYLPSNSNWNVEALSAFYISISPNEMEAYIEITDETDTVSTDSILHALHYAGICHGIDKNIIHQIADNPVSRRKYKIAAGTAPMPGRDGWYEYLFRTNPDYAPTQLPDGSVDFQNINWFETVKKNQTIAIYHPAEEGISGCTVTGRTLPAKRGTEQHILTGTGFQLLADQQTYTATITGRIQLNKEILTITNLLHLKDVSTTTGKIDFDGDISITGNVGNGAMIHATGDIIINGYVEAALIKCDGNILFRQGINGSGGGQITAKGNIMGKFFEAANVSAEGNIEIMYSLNSNLYAGGEIKALGKKGSIAGGTAYAEKGFTIHNAGNPAGLITHLNIGLNTSLLGTLSQLDNEMAEAHKQLDILTTVHARYQKKYAPEIRNTMHVFLKLEDAVYTKQQQIKRLEQRKQEINERITQADTAKVIVDNTVYDNVIVTMNEYTWRSRPIKHIIIKKAANNLTAIKM